MTDRYAGVDVSKARLDVAFWPEGGRFEVPNTPQGRAELVRRLRAAGAALVAYEPTGGYERPLAKALADAGLPGRRVDPWRVRRFAEALGRRTKTDRADALAIARFAAEVARREPARTETADPELAALSAARGGLVADVVRLKAQADKADHPLARELIQERLRLAETHLARVEAAMQARVAADQRLTRRYRLLLGAPGVGRVVALALLAELPELGARTGKQIAALVGVAPQHRQSGASPGRSAVAGGRAGLRRLLYMAALSAARCNPAWKAWRQTLTERGKPAKVTLVAVMRKLLVALNAMLKADRPFRPA